MNRITAPIARFVILAIAAGALLSPASAWAGKAFEADHTSGRTLIGYLDHPDWRFRLDAADEIADRRIVQAKPKLEELAAGDGNDRVRKAALEALMEAFGGPSSRSVVHAVMLEAGDEDLRYDVVRMIEKSPQPEDRDALIQALDDRNPHVARHAARALIRIGDRSVAPVLRDKALDATDAKVAREFNEAASRLGG